MSFLRHREIYQADNLLLKDDPSLLRERQTSCRSRAHRLDEFPGWLFLAGCSPALPASASPAGADCERTIGRLQELYSAKPSHAPVWYGQQRRASVKRTQSRRRLKWPVLTRPQMAGFEVITEAAE